MEKPLEIGSRVAVVLPRGGAEVEATVLATRVEEDDVFVRVRLVRDSGLEVEYPLSAVEPLD